jgi:hypothetical protein
VSTLPRRQNGVFLTIGLAAVGALVAAVVLFASSKASEVDLTTAKLVPADAGVYVALNTDLSSSQWVATFKLLEKLGVDDPEGQLKDGAQSGAVNWENDVAPFLGGNAAFYVRGVSITDISAQGAAILRCKDSKRALEVLKEQAGGGTEGSYAGVTFTELDLGGGYAARIADHLVIAFDEESLHDVIDVHNGKKASLASVSDFKALRDELTGNFLAFVYVSTQQLGGDFFLTDPAVRAAIEGSDTQDLAFKPAAWVIGAKSGAFEFQAASVGKSGAVGPMLAPRESQFAKLVPGDAAIFFSTTGVAQTWDGAVSSGRARIDAAIRENSEYKNLDEALKAAGKEVGLSSVKDLIQLMKGETAVAGWFPDGDSNNPEFAFLSEVDATTAAPVFDKVAKASAKGAIRTQSVSGAQVSVFTDVDGKDAAYVIKDGYVLFGSLKAVERVLAGGASLADNARYKDTVTKMPTQLGTYGYFDLKTLVRLAEGGVPADLDAAEQALNGLIINAVDQNGVVRLSGIITIGD